MVICVDEFGPLNLQPLPGRHWAARGVEAPSPGGGAGPLHPPHGVRHLLAAYDLSRDRLYGHIKPRKRRGEFLVFLGYLRTLYPPQVRIGLALDNFSPHLSTKDDPRVGDRAAATTSNWPTPDQRELAEPDRGPVPGAALLHPGWH